MIQLVCYNDTIKAMSFELKRLNKRQEAVLKYVSESDSTVSVSDVLAYTQKDFEEISRITIVRDLGMLTEEGFLERHGAGRGVRYGISPQCTLLQEVDVEKYFSVQQDNRTIKDTFNFDIFDLLKEDFFTSTERKELMSLHREFQSNFKKIDSRTIIAKEFERILIEFSWKSSRIEGNTYSLLDTEELIKNNKKAKGKTEKETRMILNHKNAFNFLLENRNNFVRLSRATIENIHQLLTEDLGITKNLRSTAIGITGTNYKPLDNKFQIEESLENMIELINNKKDFFEKSFLCLILLSYIQAFEDGNKRTARLVSNAVLFAHNSTLMSYRAVDEVEYKKASLLFYEKNNISYFKHIFMQQFEFAVKNYFKA